MTATTILFVPGLNCTSEVFSLQVAAMSARWPCAVADHTRGASIAEIASHILERAPARFALCGFSLGGYIAFEMLRQAASRVERLALLDTQAAPESEGSRERRLELMRLVEEGRFEEAEQAHWPAVVHPSRYGDTGLLEIKTRMGRELGAEQWLRHTRAIMARADSRPTLATINVPSLVLVGDSDQVTPVERAREMMAGIAGARLVVVPECGHMAPLERPDLVNAALAEWMTA